MAVLKSPKKVKNKLNWVSKYKSSKFITVQSNNPTSTKLKTFKARLSFKNVYTKDVLVTQLKCLNNKCY